MTVARPRQLISHIAPSAPATRRPATGAEPFLRPEIGFTPRWYRQNLDIDFGEQWHTDPFYRRETIISMGRELKRRFGDIPIGRVRDPAKPEDLLTGTFGGSFVAALYGVPIEYRADNCPWSRHWMLRDEEQPRLSLPT
jgi:hypothetical protein